MDSRRLPFSAAVVVMSLIFPRSFEEFSQIAKAEMEMLDIHDMFSDSPHSNNGAEVKKAKDIALKAAHSGTRFTRTARCIVMYLHCKA